MSETNFAKLTPIHNAEIKKYDEAIDFALEQEDVNNVAVTGTFSSGKSSIMLTYEDANPEKGFIHISFAHFNTDSNEDVDNNEKKDLEGKIINQLIHQVNANRIPRTNFKIKKDVSRNKIIRIVLGIIAFVIFQCHLIFFNYWHNYVNLLNNWIGEFLGSPFWMIISSIVILILSSLFIYHVITFQKNTHFFKKLKIAENEIEIFKNDADSKFDKYLDEIIYLFDKSEADVIVFEDLDRFADSMIFQRLREINLVINGKRKIEINKSKKLQGDYEKAKSKFFILRNWKKHLAKKAKKVHYLKFFYMLKDDIFTSKDRTKFFDFIIPIIPIVDSSNSYEMIRETMQKCGINNKFDDVFLRKISLYFDDMRIIKNVWNEFIIYDARVNKIELNPEKIFAALAYKNLYPKDFSLLQFNSGYIFKILSSKGIFKKEIDNRLEKTISNLRSWESKTKYTQKREQAKTYTLKDCVNELGFDEVIRLCELDIDPNYKKTSNQNKLIRFLVSEGYIDDHYCDYISYFYSNSLTSSDKYFAMVVSGNEPSLSYDYKLINIKNILYYFDNNDFKKEQILNIDLLDYLLNNQSKYQNQIDSFFDVIIKNNKRDFIKEYCEEWKNTIPQFVRIINLVWPNMFAEAVGEKEEENFLKIFSIYTLCYCDTETIKSVNQEKCLRSFISENETYLEFAPIKLEKIIEGFKFLDIKFKSISINANEELVDEVYKNNLYVLNPQNLLYMYNRYSGADSDISTLPTYTMLKDNAHLEQLCSYVSSNISEYISVLLRENNVIYDNATAATFILNSSEISSETKKAYIEKLTLCVFVTNPNASKKDKISRIQLIKDTTLWHDLVDKGFVKNSENNIVRFFLSSHKADSSLIELINDCPTFDLKNADFTESEKDEFVSAVVACNSVKDPIYKQIMRDSDLSIKEFSYDKINISKINTLIENNKILMNENNLKFIRQHYDYNLLIEFITKNIDQYIRIVEYNDDLFSTAEVFYLLDSSSIGNKQKSKLIALIKNFNDLENLVEKIDQYDNEIKISIKNVLIDAINENEDIYISIKLPKSIFYDLLNENDEVSVNILISQIKYMNYEEIIVALENTKFEDHDKFIKVFDKRKQPKFAVNENNRKLLETFKEQGIIINYKKLTSGKYSVQRTL